MNKQELVSSVATKSEIKKKDVEKIINCFTESVQEALIKGEKLVIVGFGTFEVKQRAKRIGRNPRDGSEIIIPATNVPVFKAGKNFKDLVNGRNENESE
ncbi:MAG: HU family DNA-binding protein [Clostridiales bacterium]|jgi:DNA-binding protein HU-beta|nr:HU family DNA-binding protein [Clostridiales bacterium]